MNREDYWETTIAFDCPKTKLRHTINDCFDRCEFSGYDYQKLEGGRAGAILHCNLDPQERELHSGKVRRDL